MPSTKQRTKNRSKILLVTTKHISKYNPKSCAIPINSQSTNPGAVSPSVWSVTQELASLCFIKICHRLTRNSAMKDWRYKDPLSI